MKTITFLSYIDSTNWPVDETVLFKMYGWFNTAGIGCVPDLINATYNHIRDVHQVEYQVKEFKDIDKSKPWFIYVYSNFQYRLNFLRGEADNKQLFQGFPDEIIHELVNGNAHLILSCENEAITDKYFELFYKLYKNNPSVPYNKIIHLTAAYNIHDEYKSYCDKNNISDNEKITIWYSHHGWLPWIKTYIDIYTKAEPAGPRDKKFISLNRATRSHRITFASLLAEHDLLKHGYVSLGIQDDIGWPCKSNLLSFIKTHLPDWYGWDPEGQAYKDAVSGSEKLMKQLPLTVDTDDLIFNWVGYEVHPISFAQRSYFSVVTGTNCFKRDEPGVTVNEKEFKAILCKHPFLLVTRPHTLKQLQNIGFKTFGQWFDESYDNEEDDAQRLLKITKEVERLCAISNKDWDALLEEMKSVTDHNFNWLVEHREEMSFNYTELKQLLKYAA